MTNNPPAPPSRPKPAPSLRARFVNEAAYPPRYVGRPGQGPLRRFTALSWTLALWPGFVLQFDKVVPEEFWTYAIRDDGENLASVACPCGAEPEVAQGCSAFCPGECGRVFLMVGEEIRVAKFEAEPESSEPSVQA